MVIKTILQWVFTRNGKAELLFCLINAKPCRSIYLSIYLSIYGSIAICWALAAFSVPWSYTQSVGLLGRRISPSHGRYLHTGQHKQNKRTQTSMPWVKFEPTIAVFKRAKTVHALDRTATVICHEEIWGSGKRDAHVLTLEWPTSCPAASSPGKEATVPTGHKNKPVWRAISLILPVFEWATLNLFL
jgi:hypothetical protein